MERSGRARVSPPDEFSSGALSWVVRVSRLPSSASDIPPVSFLTDVERITARNYVPTDDDILRARIKTIGVTEHKLTINAPSSVAKEWLVYDVGGARTQRAAWLPYFDTADAILFIASLSSFDQVLSEDPTVNRMVCTSTSGSLLDTWAQCATPWSVGGFPAVV